VTGDLKSLDGNQTRCDWVWTSFLARCEVFMGGYGFSDFSKKYSVSGKNFADKLII